MKRYYYLNQSNEAIGPYPLEDLQKLASEGAITNDTLVNPEGTKEWIPLEKVRNQGGRRVENDSDKGPDSSEGLAAILSKAWEVFRKLAADPVGRLPNAAQELGNVGSQKVGIAFGAVFMVSVLLAANYSAHMRNVACPLLPKLVATATPFLCFVATLGLTRLVFKGKGALGSDCLIAGTALLPFAILAPLAAVLGVENKEISEWLVVPAASTSYLLLYSGCTGVNQLSTCAATLAMPVILLGSLWLYTLVLLNLIKDSKSLLPF